MKRLLFLTAFFLSVTFLFAQKQNVHFGVKAGLNVASLNVEDGNDYDSRTSFHVGGLAHIHVSPHFAVQPEVYFSGQGGKDGSQALKLGYLNIPVLLQYMFDGGFRLQTGPQLGVLLSAKLKDGDVEIDIKDDTESIDFSWSIGAGYLFPGSGLGLDARYNLGLTNINEGILDVQNRVFSIGLFYQFMHQTASRR